MDVDEKTFRNGRSGHEEDTEEQSVDILEVTPIRNAKMPFDESN